MEAHHWGLCSLPPKCGCLKNVLSPIALVSPTQVLMLWKSVLAKGSDQSHPSVDALKECRRQGLWSVTPKCWCSERALSLRALISPTQVSMLWKSVVAKGSNQSHSSVDTLKEHRRQELCQYHLNVLKKRCYVGLWTLPPKCWCFEKALSPTALVSPSQMVMLW